MTEILSAVDLVAGFPGHEPVLDGASVRVRRGARMALLGPNGSGKTTLLRCLAGSLKPLRGTIRAEDAAVSHDRASLRRHRRLVQLVLQDPDDQLFSADVTQDVSFGPLNLGLAEEEARARVEEALELLAVTHLAERPTHQLSYGERDRKSVV